MISMLRLVLYTRWGRYLIASILLIIAMVATMSALAAGNVKMASGIVISLTEVVDSQSDAYQYSELKLAGEDATYRFYRNDFTPALTDQSFVQDGKVDLWFTKTYLNDPTIVAVQIYDGQGANPTKYVTNDYSHPEDARNRNLIPAAIFWGVGIAVTAAALFLPTVKFSNGSSRRPPTGGYGSGVLSAGQRPRSSDDKRSDGR